jgi:hypothetical protein
MSDDDKQPEQNNDAHTSDNDSGPAAELDNDSAAHSQDFSQFGGDENEQPKAADEPEVDYVKPRKRRKQKLMKWLLIVVIVGGIGSYAAGRWWPQSSNHTTFQLPITQESKVPKGGRILSVEKEEYIPADRVLAASRQNYGAQAPQPKGGVTRALIKYTSLTEDNKEITEYARAYLPEGKNKLTAIAFAPGTTGIGDICAPSLEQPQAHSWANYESHMMAYAGQGYAMVTTDYEGMRDPGRMHHYMVGELEGRAVLDSLQALRNWKSAKDRIDSGKLFVAGYSQGGHAALWAV